MFFPGLDAWVSKVKTDRHLLIISLEDGYQTDETPTEDDVYDDFDQMRRSAGIKSFGSKWVKRKYAFGEEGVSTGESDWMKVVYSFEGKMEPVFSGDILTSPTCRARTKRKSIESEYCQNIWREH